MADISKELKAFKEAIYGEDVRDNMISAFNAINNSTINLAAEAKKSETAAKASETAAKASEEAAGASRIAAAESASNANDYSVSAKLYSDNAAVHARNAADSETNAKASEDNAKASEEAAARSMEQAAILSKQESFKGATENEAGMKGAVPAPPEGATDRVLTGDGTWGRLLEMHIVKQSDGNGGYLYGYIDVHGHFVPFKSQSDIDAAVSAAKVGTAAAGDVLSGKTFTNSSASGVTGTMPNNGAKTASLNCSGSYVIPAGYHNGQGKITANSLASQTDANAGAGDILSSKTAWVKGSKVTGNMANRGAWTSTPTASGKTTIPGGYHNGNGYVDTSSVYNKGKTDGVNGAVIPVTISADESVQVYLEGNTDGKANMFVTSKAQTVHCKASGIKISINNGGISL